MLRIFRIRHITCRGSIGLSRNFRHVGLVRLLFLEPQINTFYSTLRGTGTGNRFDSCGTLCVLQQCLQR